MLKATFRRILETVPVLIGVSLVTFFAIRLIPGDAVTMVLGENYTAEAAAELRAQLGLDQNVFSQFISWTTALFAGDMGSSIRTGAPVTAEIANFAAPTLMLTAASLAISLIIAIPAGVHSGSRPGGLFDTVSRVLVVGGLSLPSFVVGVVLILLFSVQLGLLPSGGYPRAGSSPLTFLSYLILPAFSLSIATTAITLKMTRSSFLTTSRLDYVRTARSKGIAESRIQRRHILRNSLLPVVTVVGIQIGHLLGGAIVIEQVFSWPGLGTLLVQAINQRDYPVVQGVILFTTVLFIACNLIADLLYLILDPRLRHA